MIKQGIKNIVSRAGYSVKKLTAGDSPYDVQRKLVSNTNPVIFDVGAYDGQVSLEYSKVFPDSIIYAFEPFPESFATLTKAVSHKNNINTKNIALSSTSGEDTLHINGSHATNSLFSTSTESGQYWNKELLDTKKEIKVTTVTLDKFCEDNNISSIDILKLDVQGGEYEVLTGAAKLLKAKNIKLIFMEIILVPTYKGQRDLREYLNFFDKHGYKLINIHDLVRNNTNLLQLDALFVTK